MTPMPKPGSVLIVTKTTNYELHGASIEAKMEQSRGPSDVVARLRTAHAEHYATLAQLHVALDKAGIAYEQVRREDEHTAARTFDAILTVGGDGTLLSATHQMPAGGRIYGIRSSRSSVGYLCCADAEEVDELVRRLAGGAKAVPVPMVEVSRVMAEVRRVETGETITTTPVLNDFLFTNLNPAATTRYKITFNGVSEVQRSSGLWIATGAGSTAAVYAAGGQRRAIDDRSMQFKVRELYRLGHLDPTIDGALFDPDAEELVIENRCQEALLAMDGQHGLVALGYGDTLRFKRAPSIRLARRLKG